MYRAKNKKTISFTDLTLQENLNYIKYTLKDSKEAFQMFDILSKNKDEPIPVEVPASII